MTLTFLLDYQQISRTDKSVVVAGSVNYLRAKFSPKSDDWKLPVTALFNGTAVLLDENWECAVPWEVVQQAGAFTVSAFCGSLQTANTVTVPVAASGYKNGETPPEPTPDVYNQILGVMQEAKDAAETAQEAAGIAQDAAEHTPTIIDGVWHEWDAEAGEYKSTGTQAQGPEGERGPKGDKGDKGDRGDKGDKGDTGAQGPIGPTGETGPVGPQGEKGDTGSQGPQGVPGTAATITIGSVTESAPGRDASVTNSGTATAAVFNFVIPRGETGPTGATGATGPAGLGVPQPTADDAGKIPVVNADGSGYELGNPTPEVDDTLSISGAPADAAATGQAIEAVSPDDESVGAKPWSSLQIIDTLCPPLEVAGNPAVCYPVANYPLGVKASWEPRQDGSGDPSPENVRPIVGLDSVKVTRCGKNLLPYTKPSNPVYSSNGITYTWHDDGSIHVAGTSTARADSKVMNFSGFYLPPGNYVFGSTGISGLSLHLVVQKASTGSNTWYSGNVSIEPGDVPQYFYVSCQSGITVDTTVYAFLTYGDNTLTANDYAPYTGTTATLTLPETIYGGELDAVTGDGIENWRYRELDGAEGGSLGNIDASDTIQQFNLTIIDPQTDAELPCMCNMLPQTVDVTGGYALGIYHLLQSTFILGFPRAPLREYGFIDGDTETYMTAFKAYLAAQFAAGTPVTIAYKLATPTTFQATGGQSLPALPGTNTIYTDADGVTVTGRADPVQTINALNDRIAALEDAATGG